MHGSLRLLLAGAMAVTLAGCGPGETEPPAVVTPTLFLMPTVGPTPTGGSPTPTIEPLPTSGPSPTPRAYTVRANDTFLAIALAFGVTREELQAANPELNPDLLSIGQLILIPAPGAGGGTATPIPSPTPLSLQTGVPRCFPTTTGGAQCVLTVFNTTETDVEGLTGWVTFVGAGGRAILTLPLYPPLNLLPPGKAMVLSAFQPGPVPEYVSLGAALTMAVPAADVAGRYPALDWSVLSSEPSGDRRSWVVEVGVGLPAHLPDLPRVTVAILALDTQGEVIGFTKWERQPALLPGERAVERLTVYSLGPPIERVQVLAEALITS